MNESRRAIELIDIGEMRKEFNEFKGRKIDSCYSIRVQNDDGDCLEVGLVTDDDVAAYTLGKDISEISEDELVNYYGEQVGTEEKEEYAVKLWLEALNERDIEEEMIRSLEDLRHQPDKEPLLRRLLEEYTPEE